MINPYYDETFFPFLSTFCKRLFLLLSGQLSYHNLATDEIQIAVLASIGISSALVGTLLVLRRMTMLANSLSHTILLGIVIAFFFSSSLNTLHSGHYNLPLLLGSSIAVGLGTAFLTELLTKLAKLQEDASTGVVFSSLFALGIVFVTLLSRNAHIGAEVVMGNVDALQLEDIKLSAVILLLNLGLFILFYKEWQLTTFDPAFALGLGFSPGLFNYLLMTLVAMTVVGAFRAVGVLMVLIFITAPPLTARLFCKSLKSQLMVAGLIAVLTSILGIALARHLLSAYGIAISTGGVVVSLLGFFFLGCAAIQQLKTKQRRKSPLLRDEN